MGWALQAYWRAPTPSLRLLCHRRSDLLTLASLGLLTVLRVLSDHFLGAPSLMGLRGDGGMKYFLFPPSSLTSSSLTDHSFQLLYQSPDWWLCRRHYPRDLHDAQSFIFGRGTKCHVFGEVLADGPHRDSPDIGCCCMSTARVRTGRGFQIVEVVRSHWYVHWLWPHHQSLRTR